MFEIHSGVVHILDEGEPLHVATLNLKVKTFGALKQELVRYNLACEGDCITIEMDAQQTCLNDEDELSEVCETVYVWPSSKGKPQSCPFSF